MRKINFDRLSVFKKVHKNTYLNISKFYSLSWADRLQNINELKYKTDRDYGEYFIGYLSLPAKFAIIAPVTLEDIIEISEVQKSISKHLYSEIEPMEQVCIKNILTQKQGNYFYIDDNNDDFPMMCFSLCKWKEHHRVQKIIKVLCYYQAQGEYKREKKNE